MNGYKAQIIPIPSAPAAEKKDEGGKTLPAPTKDNPEATVATVKGPIKVVNPVDDEAVESALESLLPKYPGVRSVDAKVNSGIVTIEGRVENDEVRDQMNEVAKQVEGVRMVINRLKTDAQVLTALELVKQELHTIWQAISRRWLLALLAISLVLGFAALAKQFNQHSETLLSPFVENLLLRSVIGSLIGTMLVIGGVITALSVLNLTQAVLSIVGLAGVIGLALGFAFRDITENFIASVLLGLRRPFQMGDYVEVGTHAGVVKTLNTRATVLVTLDGNHVRIPNTVIYKEILVNHSASPSTRGSFDVIVPFEYSTSTAIDALNHALRDVDGVLPEPPARALVESIEANGVRLRAYYWSPSQGVDKMKLDSDARLKAKVALQEASVLPTSTECAPVSPEQARANLRKDSRAADLATVTPANGRPTPMEHVLQNADNQHSSDEGTNLLVGAGKE